MAFPPADQPQNCRATGPRNGGHQPKNWTGAAVLFNFEQLFCQCIAFEGDLSEVACAVGGTSLPAGLPLWFSFLIVPESFLTDAGPASHRVRLWRGGPLSTAPLSWQSCVSEVTCGTLEKVPSVGFVDVSTTTWEARVSVRIRRGLRFRSQWFWC